MQRRNGDALSRFQGGFPNLGTEAQPGDDRPGRPKTNANKSFPIASSDFFVPPDDNRNQSPLQSRPRKKKPLISLTNRQYLVLVPLKLSSMRLLLISICIRSHWTTSVICPASKLAELKPGRIPAKTPTSKDSLTSLAQRALQHITPVENSVSCKGKGKENPKVNTVSDPAGRVKPVNGQ